MGVRTTFYIQSHTCKYSGGFTTHILGKHALYKQITSLDNSCLSHNLHSTNSSFVWFLVIYKAQLLRYEGFRSSLNCKLSMDRGKTAEPICTLLSLIAVHSC